MNDNSKLCVCIDKMKRSGQNWRKYLTEELRLHIKEYPPYAVFTYNIDCDFDNPIVNESRGIILNIQTLDVVCWPFNKFWEHNKKRAAVIDWSTARVQAKLDGSIVKLWYNGKVWIWSTAGCVYAQDALVNEESGRSFYDVIKSADNYLDVKEQLGNLDKDLTYIFELISPENQVVIYYPTAHLYHIGTRSNITGEELDIDIHVDKPLEYTNIHSLSECLSVVGKINRTSDDGKLHSIDYEGFVVVDANWNRIKIKSPDYLMMHNLVAVGSFTKKRILELMRSGCLNIIEMCDKFPMYAHTFAYYYYKVLEVDYQANATVRTARRVYKESGGNRKVVADAISKFKLAHIGFLSLDNEKTGTEILAELNLNQYCNYIPEYVPSHHSRKQ